MSKKMSMKKRKHTKAIARKERKAAKRKAEMRRRRGGKPPEKQKKTHKNKTVGLPPPIKQLKFENTRLRKYIVELEKRLAA